jgi:hypothetical protein
MSNRSGTATVRPALVGLVSILAGCGGSARATDAAHDAGADASQPSDGGTDEVRTEEGGGDLGTADGGACPADVRAVLPAPALGPDLAGVVASTQWKAYGGSALAFDSVNGGIPITTDAAGKVNHEEYALMIASPGFQLKGGRAYEVVLRMKADVFPLGQNVAFKAQGPGQAAGESSWNVSRAGVWEDVYLPVYPVADGRWEIEVRVVPLHKYASTPSTIFVDPDIAVHELPLGSEAAARRDVDVAKDKDAFASSTERIDGLGNVYVLRGGGWKHIFPRMMYRGTNTDFATMFGRYKEYGFTGVMDVWTAAQADELIKSGLEDIAISANDGTSSFASFWPVVDRVYQWATTNGRHANVLWYNLDNENSYLGNFGYQDALRDHVDADHLDPLTGTRSHPIYYLNGHFGMPRTYESRRVMDITGSYVGGGLVGEPTLPTMPRPTVAIEFLGQNQRAPTTVIQLQSYLQQYFVPSLFYGLIQGGRAMSVWRDGTTYGGSQDDFRNNVWAGAFKDEVSPRLDRMLDLLETPHFTTWSASTSQFPDVRIGTRELSCTGYLILASFAAEDRSVVVSLQGLNAVEALDLFDGSHIADVVDGQFALTMGHYNGGYRVIRLVSH